MPPGLLAGQDLRPRDKCGRLALSFFESVDAARKVFEKLDERVDAALQYGGYIGKIDLLPTDGLMSEPSNTGHINLHQEDGVTFATRVVEYYPAKLKVEA